MLTHYLRIALRVFRRNKLYSLINIACLSIGLGVVMTILLYILHETSYDKWHKHSDRIFSVMLRESFGAKDLWTTGLTYATGPAEKLADPAVESMVRTFHTPNAVDVRVDAPGPGHFPGTSGLVYTDSNFFQFFSFRLLRGSAQSVLKRPFTVVLTEKAAKKYFGNTDPIGRTLLIDTQYRLEVTGIAADPPSNSSINFDMLASISTMSRVDSDDVAGSLLEAGNFSTWFLLRQPSDTAKVAQSLRHLSLRAEGNTGQQASVSVFKSSHEFGLFLLGGAHPWRAASGRDKYLNAFTWVAALILLLALVNYMSLATARSAMRAKEVGVRKVMGARRRRLAEQFYVESTFYAILSFIIGILIFLWFKPYFCRLMQLQIDIGFLLTPTVLCAFGGLLLLVIFASGSYPAFVLSAFRPVVVLYGKLSRQRSGERVRKGFIVFQFALTMAMVICSIIIGKQLYFFRHADTGVDKENIVMLPFDKMQHYAAYKQEIGSLPGVRGTATSDMSLYYAALLELVHLPWKTAPAQLDFMFVDSSFISVLGLQWKERPMRGTVWCDRGHLVLNETAVSAFHLDGRVTGRQLKVGDTTKTVAGVLKDFNFFSLQSHIDPFSFTVLADDDPQLRDRSQGWLFVKIAPHVNIPTLMDKIRQIYTSYDTEAPFQFQFLDDAYDANYKLEDQMARLFDLFTTITIIIACLGLFALATFAAQQRLKEIGIRKVMGASVGSITGLLSHDFLRPVLLAAVIASPLAWWVMTRWLENFAYRTTISWWIFPAAGLGLLLVALVTVVGRTVRAARINPTINLRNE